MTTPLPEQEIIAVRDAHRLDEAALARYLHDALDEFAGDLSVRQFAGGESNPTYLLSSAGHDYVLRKKPPGKLLPSAHAVEREYRVITALRDTDVPVPRTYHLCDDESIIGTPFFVMEKVEGRVLRNPALPGLPPTERRAIYEHFIDVLATLHNVDHDAVGLGDFGRPGNYYTRQFSRWSKQYEASKTEEIAAMDNLIAWLPENIPPDDSTGITHGDYRLENTIVHLTEPRIVAVLDWELCTLGHPLADVAYACMGYLGNLGGSQAEKDISQGVPGIPDENEFVLRYCRATGRERIENWTFYLAFSLFRLAAIVQGVYKRGLDGTSSSDRATQFGDTCRIRAELAWSLVERS